MFNREIHRLPLTRKSAHCRALYVTTPLSKKLSSVQVAWSWCGYSDDTANWNKSTSRLESDTHARTCRTTFRIEPFRRGATWTTLTNAHSNAIDWLIDNVFDAKHIIHNACGLFPGLVHCRWRLARMFYATVRSVGSILWIASGWILWLTSTTLKGPNPAQAATTNQPIACPAVATFIAYRQH